MGNIQLSAGRLFSNRFEIERAAGSGGMGTVYRAFDRYTGVPVALKLLNTGTGSSDEAQRFLREAQLLSELRHPGIVAHVAHGQAPDGQRFLAMEWLEGQDLGERLARGPLSVKDCLRLAGQVASALSVSHSRGIIHRDLKPSNLFLIRGDIGQVKILDFGIARRVATSQAMTKTGIVIGTPEYMAPEQARGSRDLTPAADLFSLGCVLYEGLTGQPPFVADHIAAVLVRILFEEPIPVEERRPGVPALVSTLLNRLLAKDPGHRLADAAALEAEILRLGELPEPALAATVAGIDLHKPAFAENEQELLSIVLAAGTEQPAGHEETLCSADVLTPNTDRQALLHALRQMRVAADFLANGALVVTAVPMESAHDQATQAARAALLIKELWPAAIVSMATGRGVLSGRTAVGDVVDHAASRLRAGSTTPSDVARIGVSIDTLSAKLLASRFVQTAQLDGAVLLAEATAMDASRPLLGKPTPCLGRDRELGVLDGLFYECRDESTARAVLIISPPGVGKSRLRHEFVRRLEARNEDYECLIGRGDPISTATPYGLLGQAIRRLCQLGDNEPMEERQRRLHARVEAAFDARDCRRVKEFLGELCSLPFPDEHSPALHAARKNPSFLAEQIQRAFLDFISAECHARPVLLILEDLHWSDSLTVRLVDVALRQLKALPFLVVGTGRPEVKDLFPSLWSERNVQEIGLPGLGRKACERLIQQVLGVDLETEIRDRIITQAAGNALFLEELLRAYSEGNSDALPETVLAMLQARQRRLEPGARRILRAASVFGEAFWPGGISAILGKEGDVSEVERWLHVLTEAEMVSRQKESRFLEQTEYRFHHALVRDAAYGLLTDEDRQRAHHVAGTYLEQQGELKPAVLAEHAHRGGQMERAASFYLKAAQQASDNINLKDAYKLAEQAVACVDRGGILGAARCIQASALMWQNQFARADALAAEALANLPSGTRPWLKSLAVQLFVSLLAGRYERIAPLLDQLIDYNPTAESNRDYVDTVCMIMPILCQRLGTKVAARLLQRVEQVCPDVWVPYLQNVRYEFYRHSDVDPWRQLQWAEGVHQVHLQTGMSREAMLAQNYVGEAYGELGELERGEAVLRASAVAFERHHEPYGRSHTFMHLAGLLSNRTDDEALSEVLAICQKQLQQPDLTKGFTGWCHAMLSRVYLLRRQLALAEHHARHALDALRLVPFRWLTTSATLVDVLLQQDRIAEAREAAGEMLTSIAALGKAGYAEMSARAAASLAYYHAGEIRQAHEILQAGLRELCRRANLAPDARARMLFVARVPDNLRILELARTWFGAAAIAGIT